MKAQWQDKTKPVGILAVQSDHNLKVCAVAKAVLPLCAETPGCCSWTSVSPAADDIPEAALNYTGISVGHLRVAELNSKENKWICIACIYMKFL